VSNIPISILVNQVSGLSSGSIYIILSKPTISGIASGSALTIAIIYLLSSSSPNLILFILSKHFLRCCYTADGFPV
jgi:hypothetical protein